MGYTETKRCGAPKKVFPSNRIFEPSIATILILEFCESSNAKEFMDEEPQRKQKGTVLNPYRRKTQSQNQTSNLQQGSSGLNNVDPKNAEDR